MNPIEEQIQVILTEKLREVSAADREGIEYLIMRIIGFGNQAPQKTKRTLELVTITCDGCGVEYPVTRHYYISLQYGRIDDHLCIKCKAKKALDTRRQKKQ